MQCDERGADETDGHQGGQGPNRLVSLPPLATPANEPASAHAVSRAIARITFSNPLSLAICPLADGVMASKGTYHEQPETSLTAECQGFLLVDVSNALIRCLSGYWHFQNPRGNTGP